MSDTNNSLPNFGVITSSWSCYAIHCSVAKKKYKKKFCTFLSRNKQTVSILFNQSFIREDQYNFGSRCRVDKDIADAKRAEKRKQNALKKKREDIDLFNQQMGNKEGVVITATTLKTILQIYSHFMNKPNTFIMNESRIINHRIPSKGERLLVLNIDLFNIIKDECENPITLKLNDCKAKIKSLDILHKYIHIGDDNNTYCFSDVSMGRNGIYLPKLDDAEQDIYTYELDLFNEIYIDYADINNDTANLVLSAFVTKNPIDILIAKNKIIGFQQEEFIMDSVYSNHVARGDADTILRSYNFYSFDKKIFSDGPLIVIKNGDGEFWLLTKCQCKLGETYAPTKIYENLEVLRR